MAGMRHEQAEPILLAQPPPGSGKGQTQDLSSSLGNLAHLPPPQDPSKRPRSSSGGTSTELEWNWAEGEQG